MPSIVVASGMHADLTISSIWDGKSVRLVLSSKESLKKMLKIF